MKVNKGEIYYISNPSSENYGTETQKDRPAIVVSSVIGDVSSSGVIVVFLTTKPKCFSDYHFTLHSSGRPSTALVEQMRYVDAGRIGDYIGTLNEEEMNNLDECILKVHNIEINKYRNLLTDTKKEVEKLTEELAKRDVQIDAYKDMLQGLYTTK